MSSHRSIAALCAIALASGCNAGHGVSALPQSIPNSVSAPRTVRPANAVPYGPVNFAYTGGTQTYVVPSGVTSVTITAWGAGSSGILGGRTQATVPVTSGETLSIVVGGAGERSSDDSGGAGGFGGGANGGRSTCCKNHDNHDPGMGGGGGSWVVHQNGSYAVVAGGAGGASGSGKQGGAGGGTEGQGAPNPYGGTGGSGGTQSCGHPSTGTQGGASVYGGGGGGGGYCGGNGGSGSKSRHGWDPGDAGGGGGSGYYEKDATGDPYTHAGLGGSGNGHVLIVPPPKTFTLATGIYALHVAVDRHGNAFVTLPGEGSIEMISPSGNVTLVGSGLKNAQGVAVDDSGKVYVADEGHRAVKEISPPFDTPAHGTIETVASGNLIPEGLALDFKGNLWITARSEGALKRVWWGLRRIDLKTKGDSIVYWDYTDKGNVGYNLAIDPHCVPASGNNCSALVQVITNRYELWKIGYSGYVTSKLSAADLGLDPLGAVALSNNIVYATDSQGNKVNEVAGGKATPIGSGWNGPVGVSVEPACSSLCTVWVTEGNSGRSLKMWVP